MILKLTNYCSFVISNKLPYINNITLRMASEVNESNRDRTLMLRKIHQSTTPEEIVSFLKAENGTVDPNEIFFEQFKGRKTGIVAVRFKDKDSAVKAK